MKRRLLILGILVLCIGAAAIVFQRQNMNEKGDISGVEIDYGDSQFFTDREMEQAAEALMDAFQTEFPDYTLQKIWYVTDLRQLENDQDVPYDGRNIIFYSDMERKPECKDETLPELLPRYRWCIAVNDGGRWYVAEHGF